MQPTELQRRQVASAITLQSRVRGLQAWERYQWKLAATNFLQHQMRSYLARKGWSPGARDALAAPALEAGLGASFEDALERALAHKDAEQELVLKEVCAEYEAELAELSRDNADLRAGLGGASGAGVEAAETVWELQQQHAEVVSSHERALQELEHRHSHARNAQVAAAAAAERRAREELDAHMERHGSESRTLLQRVGELQVRYEQAERERQAMEQELAHEKKEARKARLRMQQARPRPPLRPLQLCSSLPALPPRAPKLPLPPQPPPTHNCYLLAARSLCPISSRLRCD